MFPRIPKEHPARQYIAANIIANILGLGWACTPAGLKAMEELAKLEEQRGTSGYAISGRQDGGTHSADRAASHEMCTFLILNISSLQLIPVNMIAYRSQYGSTEPTAVIAPAIAATLISTFAAVLFCKVMDRSGRGKTGWRV
jgi:spore maturation protein A